ncbi:MAG: hypothetical protein A2151_03445 [Candidatus Muproteobacteria bacterium RBG_16_65_34]|uniref:TonB-dependent receptor n=1 Tax=Candidatus Muproteobacteria bacterium RBG_16_65_34 TaxID=1817760 RepID=A0A1F6TKU2_9PROT|nr:MAG: hypothetical protein A2151_03445 [Candidatus Muproteobacteria bacterium RBG_16_65_34]
MPCRYLITAALSVAAPTVALAASPDNPPAQTQPDAPERLRAIEERIQRLETAPATAAANSFNPAISLILSGRYANLSQDPATYRLTGFPVPSGADIGPGARGFGLAESELGVYANVDPYFYGGLSYALHPDDTASVEEAFVQTIALSGGLTVKAGRSFSGIGYLNAQHAHLWDFVDAPLAYQAFLGTQFGDDGVQVRWLAPTDIFLEFGAELGRGRAFPGSDRDRNGSGAGTVFVHAGGDAGPSHSWRAGLSVLGTAPRNRAFADTDLAGNTVTNAFSGDSRLWVADFVWKYAPNGNAADTNFILQAEYLRRHEHGDLIYDTVGAATAAPYDARQSGWYLQGVYQFRRHWRAGLRTEQLDRGAVDYGSNNANLARPDFSPSKNSVMLDYSPSEFSRIRLQFARDHARADVADNQAFVQYQMSLGAHGAHQF